MRIAVSACLLGERCRYDGDSKPDDAVLALRDSGCYEVVAVCPEIAGGLGVPRAPSEIVTDDDIGTEGDNGALRVVDAEGVDRTDAFVLGAQRTLDAMRKSGCELAILKDKSPSCGSNFVHDGTFSDTLVPGCGVTTRLLQDAGFTVIDETQVQGCDLLRGSVDE